MLQARIDAQGQTAFHACFNDKFKTTAKFRAATKQADAIVAGLAKN